MLYRSRLGSGYRQAKQGKTTPTRSGRCGSGNLERKLAINLSYSLSASEFGHRDSKHVAYSAVKGRELFVVFDGVEGKTYYGILTIGGEEVIFDSPDSFHYSAIEGHSFYLVEKRME